MLRTILLASILALSAAQAADQPKELVFGIISTEASSNLKSIWEPFLKDMEKGLGVPVKPFFASDYAGVIEGMRFGKVDIAWYGNKSAIEAVDRAGAEVFVQTVDAEGNPGYWSLIITHKDSAIKDLDDLLANGGQYSFGNGDPNSTSGFLVPSAFVFSPKGIDPKSHFKRMTSGNHEANALAVATKQVDASTFNTESMRRLEKTNPDKASQLRVLWKSPLIPSDPICWRKNLPEDQKTKIKSWFLGYGKTDAEKGVLKALQWAPFKDSGDYQLLPIRKLELAKKKNKVMADEKLAQADKQAQAAEIDAQIKIIEADIAKREAAVR